MELRHWKKVWIGALANFCSKNAHIFSAPPQPSQSQTGPREKERSGSPKNKRQNKRK